MKISVAKPLVKKLKALQWEEILNDFYFLHHSGYNFYKRKISKNYWRFIVSNDITSCTFQMYEKER